jgi:multimeric flavodoxin WrbA
LNRVAGVMETEGVEVSQVYALDHTIAFGMIEDGASEGLKDEWPKIQKQIMDADILILGTPIWLGTKSSVATLVIERMYAYSGEHNEKDQYLYYGKTGGCVITGNEDGIKHCSMDLLYAMQHIGYTIPPQADCGWIGEAGPGPSYGDPIEGTDKRVGFDNDFTNKNATFMAWNLMHMAKMLKDNDGIPAVGNTTKDWEHVTNAKHQNPEYR